MPAYPTFKQKAGLFFFLLNFFFSFAWTPLFCLSAGQRQSGVKIRVSLEVRTGFPA
jgi:hypothetical protein